MQWIAPSEKDTATLEKRLWAAADQLRDYSRPGIRLDTQ
jgi:hypothetical protein